MDIYAFGMILWQLWACRPLTFAGGEHLGNVAASSFAVYDMVKRGLRLQMASFPQGLQHLVDRCTSHDPANRYTIDEVGDALRDPALLQMNASNGQGGDV